MYAVSMSEAIGSAATANAEGNAIPNISLESASILKISLHTESKVLILTQINSESEIELQTNSLNSSDSKESSYELP